MPYTVEFNTEKDFLHAKANGDAQSLEDIYAYGQEIIEASVRYKQQRILMDFRGVYMNLQSYDATTYTEHMMEIGLPELGLRLAALVDEKDLEITKNFETAFRNRSIVQRAFTEFDPAVAWLTKKS